MKPQNLIHILILTVCLAFSPKGEYGKWILSHNAVIKINDSLFVHGGIAPAYLSMSISEMNKAILAELNNFSKLKPDGIVMGSDGPLWYRGLAQGTADLLSAHVDKALETYGVKRIVIGHTPVPGLVVPRFGSKVLMIDAGMSAVYNMGRAALILENNDVFALSIAELTGTNVIEHHFETEGRPIKQKP